jgi:DNA-binding protein H-NS
VPRNNRELYLEELRTLERQLRETMLERVAELIALLRQVAAAKQQARESDEKWRKFQEWYRRREDGEGA